MFSAMEVVASLPMACGHSQQHTIRYHTKAQGSTERFNLAKMICADCRSKLFELHSAILDGPEMNMAFPELSGSEKMVKWASSIRAQRFAQFGRILQALSGSADNFDKGAWKSMYLMFMIVDSKYWINGRDLGYSAFTWSYETGYIMKPPTYGDALSEHSPYAIMKKSNPFALQKLVVSDLSNLQAEGALPPLNAW